MSKASVKKALKGMSQEDMVEMVMELYSLRKEARDYLEFWADPDIDREFETLKTRLERVFFLPQEKPRRKPDFTDAKTLMKNFLSLVVEPDTICDALVYYAELILRWLKARNGIGMMANHKRLYDAIGIAETEVANSGLEAEFGHRLKMLRSSADDFYSHASETGRRGWRRWFRY